MLSVACVQLVVSDCRWSRRDIAGWTLQICCWRRTVSDRRKMDERLSLLSLYSRTSYITSISNNR